MYKKINFNMRFMALFSMILSTLIIFIVCYSMFTTKQKNEINNETMLIANVLNNNDDYNSILGSMAPSLGDKHALLISPDNKVLYNFNVSDKSISYVLDRLKIINDNKNNSKNTVYFSSSLSSILYSCFMTLDNGNILCVIAPLHNIWNLIFTFGIPIALMVLLIYLLSVSISMRLTENIIKPIEKSYSFNRENYDDMYEEIQPFLKRIARQNKEIRQNLAELKKAEKIRKEFSANVSHELKTPLTTIKGYSQIISNGIAKDKDIPQFANKIEKETSRLIILIDDIIKLSDLDENEGVVQKDIVCLKETANKVCERLYSFAETKGININLSGEEVKVHANENQIGELIYNLVDNAIKYNKDNGTITIISGTTDDNKSFISVEDTGIGIPQKYLNRIFERFFRVDKSHSKLINGTGLGLSIVKHIAIVSNADIKVKSEENKGTKFTIIFNE